MDRSPQQARQYSKARTRVLIAHLFLAAAFLAVVLFSGLSVFLRDFVRNFSANFYAQVALYLLVFAGVYFLLSVGLEFHNSFLLEHRFGLSNQTAWAWLKTTAKKGLLSLLMLLAAGEALYFFLKTFPHFWWLMTAAAWLLMTVVLGRIAPVLIIPLFYKCSPLADEELKKRLLALCGSCGVPIEKVFEIRLSADTKKANAAVAGFGKTRRILLGDTLLKNFSPDEIEAVFAHELAHIRLLHTWKILAFGTAASLAGFFLTHLLFSRSAAFLRFEAIHDIAAFPLLAMILTALTLVFMPLQLACLRRLEKNADLFAVRHIRNSQSFASAMKKLAGQNLIDESPGRLEELLLHDHPPIAKRLDYMRDANPWM